jgi:hypothetical protein
VALFRRKNDVEAEPVMEPEAADDGSGSRKKGAPTPTRKQAEAERRKRLTHQMTKKEVAKRQRAERMQAMQRQENSPERQLLRDYVDSRRRIGEFLLPGMIVILAASFLYTLVPNISLAVTVVMYLFIAGVVFDTWWMWRGYKKLLAQRLPNSSTRGLLMYGMNRSIQIRRFRMPAPRLKPGEKF